MSFELPLEYYLALRKRLLPYFQAGVFDGRFFVDFMEQKLKENTMPTVENARTYRHECPDGSKPGIVLASDGETWVNENNFRVSVLQPLKFCHQCGEELEAQEGSNG